MKAALERDDHLYVFASLVLAGPARQKNIVPFRLKGLIPLRSLYQNLGCVAFISCESRDMAYKCPIALNWLQLETVSTIFGEIEWLT